MHHVHVALPQEAKLASREKRLIQNSSWHECSKDTLQLSGVRHFFGHQEVPYIHCVNPLQAYGSTRDHLLNVLANELAGGGPSTGL